MKNIGSTPVRQYSLQNTPTTTSEVPAPGSPSLAYYPELKQQVENLKHLTCWDETTSALLKMVVGKLHSDQETLSPYWDNDCFLGELEAFDGRRDCRDAPAYLREFFQKVAAQLESAPDHYQTLLSCQSAGTVAVSTQAQDNNSAVGRMLYAMAWNVINKVTGKLCIEAIPIPKLRVFTNACEDLRNIYRGNYSPQRKLGEMSAALDRLGQTLTAYPERYSQEYKTLKGYLDAVVPWLKSVSSQWMALDTGIHDLNDQQSVLDKVVGLIAISETLLSDPQLKRAMGKDSLDSVTRGLDAMRQTLCQVQLWQSLPNEAELGDYLGILAGNSLIKKVLDESTLKMGQALAQVQMTAPYPSQGTLPARLAWLAGTLSNPALREQLQPHLEMLLGGKPQADKLFAAFQFADQIRRFPMNSSLSEQALWLLNTLDKGAGGTPVLQWVNQLKSALGADPATTTLLHRLLTLNQKPESLRMLMQEIAKAIAPSVGKLAASHVAGKMLPASVVRELEKFYQESTSSESWAVMCQRIASGAWATAKPYLIAGVTGDPLAAATVQYAQAIQTHTSWEQTLRWFVAHDQNQNETLQFAYSQYLNAILIWQVYQAFNSNDPVETEDNLRQLARQLKDCQVVKSYPQLEKLINLIPLLPALREAQQVVQAQLPTDSWLTWGQQWMDALANSNSRSLLELRDQLSHRVENWLADALMSTFNAMARQRWGLLPGAMADELALQGPAQSEVTEADWAEIGAKDMALPENAKPAAAPAAPSATAPSSGHGPNWQLATGISLEAVGMAAIGYALWQMRQADKDAASQETELTEVLVQPTQAGQVDQTSLFQAPKVTSTVATPLGKSSLMDQKVPLLLGVAAMAAGGAFLHYGASKDGWAQQASQIREDEYEQDHELTSTEIEEVNDYLQQFIQLDPALQSPVSDSPPLYRSQNRRRRDVNTKPNFKEIFDELYTSAGVIPDHKEHIYTMLREELSKIQQKNPNKFTVNISLLAADYILLTHGGLPGPYKAAYQSVGNAFRMRLKEKVNITDIKTYLAETPPHFSARRDTETAKKTLNSYREETEKNLPLINGIYKSNSKNLDDIIDTTYKKYYSHEFNELPTLDQTHTLSCSTRGPLGLPQSFQKEFSTKEILLGAHKRFAVGLYGQRCAFPKANGEPHILSLQRHGYSVTNAIERKFNALFENLEKNEEFKDAFINSVDYRTLGILIEWIGSRHYDNLPLAVRLFLKGTLNPQLVTLPDRVNSIFDGPKRQVIPGLLALSLPNNPKITYISLLTSEVIAFDERDYSSIFQQFIIKHLSIFDKEAWPEGSLKPILDCEDRYLREQSGTTCTPIIRRQYEKNYQAALYNSMLNQIKVNIDSSTYTTAEYENDKYEVFVKSYLEAIGLVAGLLSLVVTGPMGATALAAVGFGAGVGEILINANIAASTDSGSAYNNAIREIALGAVFTAVGTTADLMQGSAGMLKRLKQYKSELPAIRTNLEKPLPDLNFRGGPEIKKPKLPDKNDYPSMDEYNKAMSDFNNKWKEYTANKKSKYQYDPSLDKDAQVAKENLEKRRCKAQLSIEQLENRYPFLKGKVDAIRGNHNFPITTVEGDQAKTLILNAHGWFTSETTKLRIPANKELIFLGPHKNTLSEPLAGLHPDGLFESKNLMDFTPTEKLLNVDNTNNFFYAKITNKSSVSDKLVTVENFEQWSVKNPEKNRKDWLVAQTGLDLEGVNTLNYSVKHYEKTPQEELTAAVWNNRANGGEKMDIVSVSKEAENKTLKNLFETMELERRDGFSGYEKFVFNACREEKSAGHLVPLGDGNYEVQFRRHSKREVIKNRIQNEFDGILIYSRVSVAIRNGEPDRIDNDVIEIVPFLERGKNSGQSE
ncbi:putative adhesin [Pseudomonas brassicacearum]|uniref:Putative adhesin Stv domain-containing protein n=1 Tax=Pseudomonas brassicacearum TaxID=930166 RepID=A0A423GNI3_9PSED|nr:hypothetical protein [Pseudomonas brassicacearum]ROM93897.1 hypothetical protein BK658_19775 [Pseudomonas brassicacearum]